MNSDISWEITVFSESLSFIKEWNKFDKQLRTGISIDVYYDAFNRDTQGISAFFLM